MASTAIAALDHRVAAVRRFNRFYTRVIGALREGLLQSRFSLAEARVLYELAQRAGTTATELGRDLDAGRRLPQPHAAGVRARRPAGPARLGNRPPPKPAVADRGRAARPLLRSTHVRARKSVRCWLAWRSPRSHHWSPRCSVSRHCLARSRNRAWLLRQHRPGDIGWVVARHGALYAEEYGFDHASRRWSPRLPATSSPQHDPARERCWIAERDGVNVGSVFLVRKSDEVAKLRLLIVEPAARGLGIGRRLVAECIGFARQAGYRGITLWTNDILVAARAIYQQAGFRLVASSPHRDFGPPMVGEDWDLALR